MDMWEPYIQATRKAVPGADGKIVFDRYHIMAHLNGAVDRVRRKEHKELRERGRFSQGDAVPVALERGERPQGAAFRVRVPEAAGPQGGPSPRDEGERFAASGRTGPWDGRSASLRTGTSGQRTAGSPDDRGGPHAEATSRGRPRLHSAPCDQCPGRGINSKIETIKKMACGFRNREHFRTAILFHCGGLDLYPKAHHA